MGEINFHSQEELRREDPKQKKLEKQSQYQELLGEDELIVILVDRSGSILEASTKHYELIEDITEKALSAGKKVAVYGFDSHQPSTENVNIYNYKTPDSDLSPYRDFVSSGGAAGALLPALGFVGQVFNPSQGGTLIVLTDGLLEPQEDMKISDALSDLRQAGMRVIGLLDISTVYPSSGHPELIRRLMNKIFRSDYREVDKFNNLRIQMPKPDLSTYNQTKTAAIDEPLMRLPQEWASEDGLIILDPDGWRGKGDPSFEEPCTKEEYQKRMPRCTVRSLKTLPPPAEL